MVNLRLSELALPDHYPQGQHSSYDNFVAFEQSSPSKVKGSVSDAVN